jgi:hypothetical protein
MLFLLCSLLLASVCHGARIALLNGTSINGPIATNSVLTDINLEDGLAVSYSQTDSQISLAPFDDDWAAVDEGTLVGDLTVVSGASNIVSVLFGDADDPAFTIESDGQWTILPSGQFASHMDTDPSLPIQTNLLSFVLRTPHGQPHITVRTSTNAGSYIDLPPITWHWNISAYHPSNWQSISLLLAGPEAKILGLRLKWRPDGTQLILR